MGIKFWKELNSCANYEVVRKDRYISSLLLLLLSIASGSVAIESQFVAGSNIDYDSPSYESYLVPVKNNLATSSYSEYSIFSLYDQIITHSLADPGKVLPPRVVMNYSGTEYEGELIAYKFRQTASFGHLNPLTTELSGRDAQTGELKNIMSNPSDIIANLNNSLVEIKIENGTEIRFAIANSPAQLPPTSLSIIAYAPNPFEAVKVLDVDEQDPTNISFHIDLDPGKYYLMATATWSAATSVEDQKKQY